MGSKSLITKLFQIKHEIRISNYTLDGSRYAGLSSM